MSEYYIGLMSGTSMDGIDAVVASFGEGSIELHAKLVSAYPDALRRDLVEAVRDPATCSVDDIGRLDREVGTCFRDATLALLDTAGLDATAIRAIGSHGQTLRHQPGAPLPYSLQIGDAASIAQGTGIVTVADFRRADIAAGGQGAPLVPPFHAWLFDDPDKHQVILNIGGISNVTILGAGDTPVTGFDTGPGNTLLDAWARSHLDANYDHDGAWAGGGSVIDTLLESLLSYPYFERQPPKSTGLEEFNLGWLSANRVTNHAVADVQATISELTARTIADAVRRYAPATEEVFVCGGGAHNRDLLQRLGRQLPDTRIETTAVTGLDPDWVEAAAFAWLARQTVQGLPGNLPSVTGASRKVVLGTIHSP